MKQNKDYSTRAYNLALDKLILQEQLRQVDREIARELAACDQLESARRERFDAENACDRFDGGPL